MKNLLAKLALIGLIAYAVSPVAADATSQLTNRSAAPSSSVGGATGVTYTIGFTYSALQSVGSVKVEICDSPVTSTACAGTGNSSGASLGSATLGSMTPGAGWSIGSQTGASASGTNVVLTRAASNLSGAAVLVLNNVTNPTATAKQYYLRVSTYTDATASSPAYPGTDYGAMALSTAQAITVSGTMPESLVFCVGTVWTTDCTDISGSAVDLGTFSPTGTNTGTSVMSASTNAGSGYAITINGTVPTSGSNSIAAMGTQSANSLGCTPSCSSTTGVSQFGSNVRSNATPPIGANVTGTGSGTGSGGYNSPDNFRFFSGDTVASAATQTNSNKFTNSYIVNVGGSQAAGLYTATLTYICTATF